VISPLLANAKLVRYADDFVALALEESGALSEYIESKLGRLSSSRAADLCGMNRVDFLLRVG
jgi:hypothetical protein